MIPGSSTQPSRQRRQSRVSNWSASSGPQLAGQVRGTVQPDDPMSALEQTLRHVSAHSSETDHCGIHKSFSFSDTLNSGQSSNRISYYMETL